MKHNIIYLIIILLTLASCSLGRTLPKNFKISILSKENEFFETVNTEIGKYLDYKDIIIDTTNQPDYYLEFDTLITSFSESPITELCEDYDYDCEYTYETRHYKFKAQLLDSNCTFLSNVIVVGSNDERYSIKNIENRYKISLFSPFRVKYKGMASISSDGVARAITRSVSNYIYETRILPLKAQQKAEKKRNRKKRRKQ